MSYEVMVGTGTSPHGTQTNCVKWGTYEPPNSGPEAGLCNGGMVDGVMWAPCPSKDACRAATQQRVLREARERGERSLPIARSTVTVLGGQNQPFGGSTSVPASTLPQRPAAGAPAAVIQPDTSNPYMKTARVGSAPRAGMHSPTFLPKKKEGWFSRLGKNMLQGMFNAMGWHVHDFTSNVDIFPHEDEE